jgi:hypothetical protein
MAVITLPDGSKGYNYPKRSQAYTPTKTPHVGATVFLKAQPHVIIREAAGTYRAFYQRKDEACYWIAPVEVDGTIGAMTTQWISARDMMRSN